MHYRVITPLHDLLFSSNVCVKCKVKRAKRRNQSGQFLDVVTCFGEGCIPESNKKLSNGAIAGIGIASVQLLLGATWFHVLVWHH